MRTTWFIVAVFAGATVLGQGVVPAISGSPMSTPYLPPVDYGYGGYDLNFYLSTAWGKGMPRRWAIRSARGGCTICTRRRPR